MAQLRKCYFYFDGSDLIDRTPDFNNAHVGFFHQWSSWDGRDIAIIEDTVGKVHITVVEFLKFDTVDYKWRERLRKCYFYQSDSRAEERRHDFSTAEIGFFHQWGSWDGRSTAIVEQTDGRARITIPEYLKFDLKH